MEGRIKLTPDQLRSVANIFRERSNFVKDLLQGLNTQVDNIASSWDGATQDKYFAQFMELQIPLNKFPQALGGIAYTLDNVAQTFEDADHLLATNMGDVGIASGTGRLYTDEVTSMSAMRSLAGTPAACAMGGDPINLSTGNFVYYKEDIEISGRFPLVFKRFYNAIGSSDSVLGSNWTHSFNIHLADKKDTIGISFDDGRLETYNKLEDGSFAAPTEHSKNVLQKLDDGYLLTLPTRDKYEFNGEGQLLSISDPNENCTQFLYSDGLLSKVSNPCGSFSFIYNDSRLLEQVVDHTGRKLKLEYEGGQLVKAVHPSGASFRYVYNEHGLLSKIVNPLGISSIRNKYDDKNRTVSQRFADGGTYALNYNDEKLTTTVTEQNGNKIKYLRDKYYRTVKIVYDGSNERFAYDENNNRTMYIDRNCNVRKFRYDDQKNLIGLIDPMGGSVNIKYNEFDKPVEVVGQNGGVTSIEYNPQGNIVKLVDPLKREMQFTNNSQGLPTGYILPDASEASVEYDVRGNIVAIIDSDGSRSQFEYDSLNRVVKTINGEGAYTLFEHNAKGDITRVTNAVGDTCSYEYNTLGKVSRVVGFDGGIIEYKYNSVGKVEEIIDQVGGSTKYTFDCMWNVTSVTDPNGNTVRYCYDKHKRIIQSIDEEGYETNYQHDQNGNVTAVISPNGARTEIKYDALDRQYEIVEPNGSITKLTYDKGSNVVEVTDALGNTTLREYDLADQLVSITDPLGNKTKFTYTPLGQVEHVINAEGEKTTHSYYPGGKLKSVSLPGGESETYIYNKNGDITQTIDSLGNKTLLKYDCLSRVSETTNPLGHSKKFGYDPMGNITHVEDENGHVTQYRYSLLGDVIEVIDATGHSAKYEYDSARKLTKLEQYRLIDDTLVGVKCPEYQITEYHRNKKGEVIVVKSPLGVVVKFGYDSIGNVTSKVDEDALETLYEYNLVGQLTKVSYADGKTVEYGYDALNQLTQMKDWLGTTSIELDALGRATRVTDFDGNEVKYTWNNLGQRDKLVYPDGSEVRYKYNSSGLLNKVLSESGITKYSYDAMGQMTERILPDNTVTKHEIDSLGRYSSLTHSKNGELLDKFKYSYDPVGNITQIEKHRQGMEADSGIFQYSYDPLGRLMEASSNHGSKKYHYDKLGNRVMSMQDGVETKHCFNARNQLIRTQEGDVIKDYRYDGRGNLTQVTENGQIKASYSFDATNMMVGAIVTGKGTAEYAYNGFMERVRKLESLQNGEMETPNPCREIRYILDTTLPYDNLLMTQGTQEQSFIWGNDLISATGNDSFYYAQDHLGSPIRLLGAQRSSMPLSYDEFGMPLTDDMYNRQNLNNPFGFTGYQTDDVSGLYYAQARYYEPLSSRMLSEDLHWNPDNMIYGDSPEIFPHGALCPEMGAIAQSTNAYSYGINNPLKYYDKDGEFIITAIVITAKVGIKVGTKKVAKKGGKKIASQLLDGARDHAVKATKSSLWQGVKDGVKEVMTNDEQTTVNSFLAGFASGAISGLGSYAASTRLPGSGVQRAIDSLLVSGFTGFIGDFCRQLALGRGPGEIDFFELGLNAGTNALGSGLDMFVNHNLQGTEMEILRRRLSSLNGTAALVVEAGMLRTRDEWRNAMTQRDEESSFYNRASSIIGRTGIGQGEVCDC